MDDHEYEANLRACLQAIADGSDYDAKLLACIRLLLKRHRSKSYIWAITCLLQFTAGLVVLLAGDYPTNLCGLFNIAVGVYILIMEFLVEPFMER